jgi:hypothetical protein
LFASIVLPGIALMIPAVLYWLISLISIAREHQWYWFVAFLLLLPLAPVATLAYDLKDVRESAG